MGKDLTQQRLSSTFCAALVLSFFVAVNFILAAPTIAFAQPSPVISRPMHVPFTNRMLPVEPEALAIRKYLDGLPKLALVPSDPGSVQQMVGLPEGLSGQEIVNAKVVNQAAELALFGTFADIVWPGSLVQGNSIASNFFAPIVLPRSGGRIRLATNFVGSSGSSQYKDIPIISAGDSENAIREILTELHPTDSVGTVSFDQVTAGTLREAMIKLGVAYKGSSFSASLDTSLNASYNQNTVVAKFTQVFYTAAFDPDPSNPNHFFDSNVTLNDVKRFAQPGNPPLYVSEVKYGRILLAKFTGNVSKIDLEAAVKAAYQASQQSVSGSVDVSYKETLSNLQSYFLSVGSTGETVSRSIGASNADDLIAAIRAEIQAGLKYDPNTNPGAPVAVVMRYVGSVADGGPYGIAIAQMVTQASPEVIDLHAKQVCNDDPPRTRPPFMVWDGAGGGPVDTGIDINPGDKVTFKATGTNWSGVFASGDYGPRGWYTWDAPQGTGYPITDRSPFALIARFGNSSQTGVDTTKWGYTNDPNKEPSAWFFVGDATEATAGDADRQTGRGTPGVGRLWLGTNDNNPYNGDPSKKFTVIVCFTRKVY